jgi:hypothetical protein
MPGLVPGIHGVPLQRTSLLNSRVFPQPVRACLADALPAHRCGRFGSHKFYLDRHTTNRGRREVIVPQTVIH